MLARTASLVSTQSRGQVYPGSQDVACGVAAAALAHLGHHDHWPLRLRYRLLCGAALAIDALPSMLIAGPGDPQQAWVGAADCIFDAAVQTVAVLLHLIDVDGLPAGQGGPPAGSLGSLLWATAATPAKLVGCLRFLGRYGDHLLSAGTQHACSKKALHLLLRCVVGCGLPCRSSCGWQLARCAFPAAAEMPRERIEFMDRSLLRLSRALWEVAADGEELCMARLQRLSAEAGTAPLRLAAAGLRLASETVDPSTAHCPRWLLPLWGTASSVLLSPVLAPCWQEASSSGLPANLAAAVSHLDALLFGEAQHAAGRNASSSGGRGSSLGSSLGSPLAFGQEIARLLQRLVVVRSGRGSDSSGSGSTGAAAGSGLASQPEAAVWAALLSQTCLDAVTCSASQVGSGSRQPEITAAAAERLLQRVTGAMRHCLVECMGPLPAADGDASCQGLLNHHEDEAFAALNSLRLALWASARLDPGAAAANALAAAACRVVEAVLRAQAAKLTTPAAAAEAGTNAIAFEDAVVNVLRVLCDLPTAFTADKADSCASALLLCCRSASKLLLLACAAAEAALDAAAGEQQRADAAAACRQDLRAAVCVLSAAACGFSNLAPSSVLVPSSEWGAHPVLR